MSRPPILRLAVPLAAIGLAAGCAQQGEFPSLAPRSIEHPDAPAPAAAVPTGTDAALLARLGPIVEAAEAGHRDFLNELAGARPTIEKASGAAAGGEAWVAGQQALSRLESARGTLVAALADLDALRRERAEDPTPGNQAALDQAAQRLGTLDTEQAAALTELAAKIG